MLSKNQISEAIDRVRDDQLWDFLDCAGFIVWYHDDDMTFQRHICVEYKDRYEVIAISREYLIDLDKTTLFHYMAKAILGSVKRLLGLEEQQPSVNNPNEGLTALPC